METPNLIEVKITLAQSRAYADAQRPLSIPDARKRVLAAAATKAGRARPRVTTEEPDALIGALLDLLAIPARSAAELAAKQRTLIEFHHSGAASWLEDVIIGAALTVDYRGLALSPKQERRLKRMLLVEDHGDG